MQRSMNWQEKGFNEKLEKVVEFSSKENKEELLDNGKKGFTSDELDVISEEVKKNLRNNFLMIK